MVLVNGGVQGIKCEVMGRCTGLQDEAGTDTWLVSNMLP